MIRPARFLCVAALALASRAAADEPAVTSPAAALPPPLDRRWSEATSPAPGPPLAIGAYANGCLQGAVPLPSSGAGYQVMRPSRRRFYAHPDLVAFVKRLAGAARAQHLPPLLVGDASQPRGGPTPSGHHSHQTGLDVDIAFARPPAVARRALTASERERLSVPAVVELGSGRFTPAWTPTVPRLLALAASDAAVDRIFVNPAIKRELCATSRGQPWLARLRPWWGHHDHFHVRLRCPAGDAACEAQDPGKPATADADDQGCGPTLAWWWSDDARATLERRTASPAPAAPMPAACAALVPAPPVVGEAAAGPAKALQKVEPAARPAGLR